jgi:hypothetical protein
VNLRAAYNIQKVIQYIFSLKFICLGGVGTLTVNNAQPLDQGAYTCEAINVKGRVLATPDCIVRIV